MYGFRCCVCGIDERTTTWLLFADVYAGDIIGGVLHAFNHGSHNTGGFAWWVRSGLTPRFVGDDVVVFHAMFCQTRVWRMKTSYYYVCAWLHSYFVVCLVNRMFDWCAVVLCMR